MFSLQDFMEDEDRALSDLVEPITSNAQGRRRGLGRGVRPRGAKPEAAASRRVAGAEAQAFSTPEGEPSLSPAS